KELDSARREMDEDEYDQESECSFTAAVKGAYYGRLLAAADDDGRIAEVPFDPALPVSTGWDIGIGDDTVIWFFQQTGGWINVIDYYANRGEGMAHYKNVLDQRSIEQRYVYGTHYGPHDLEAREWGSGKTRQEQASALGLDYDIVSQIGIKDDGHNAVRAILPRCRFDMEKCAEGIEALRQYRREWDDKNRTFRDRPLHDWCFTGDTKLLTRHGMRRIMDLPETGKVLTPCGWKRYHSPRVTRKNAPLVEVRFIGGYTIRCTPDHMFLTENGWKYAKNLTTSLPVLSTLTQSQRISMAVYTVVTQAINTGRAAAGNFIGMFGSQLSVLFPTSVTSTIGTATQTTTGFRTWSAWTPRSICRKRGKSDTQTEMSTFLNMQDRKPQIGMVRKRAVYGIAGTQKELSHGQNGSVNRKVVLSAMLNLWRWFVKAAMHKNTVRKTAAPVVIESVRPLHDCDDVWCLTVPDGEAFSLSNGAVVHNCSHPADGFQTLALGIQDRYAPLPKKKDRYAKNKEFSTSWMAN
ncbi:MAG TPA: hypothetical protein ENI27_08400, partial [bacterium]|nr:hypothetical protein [bacterium]